MLIDIYNKLLSEYGPQCWWPGDGPLDVVIGAVLTQNTSWSNVEKAILNLKHSDLWSLESIHNINQDKLAGIIRPSGYFNQKARKLKAFAEHVCARYEGNLEIFLSLELPILRQELLSIYGVGPETADDILVYAASKPSFIVDVYTKRVLGRIGVIEAKQGVGYEVYQKLIQDQLPRDVQLYNEFHALLDYHAKYTCKKIPLCTDCLLLDVCESGRVWIVGGNDKAIIHY
jgi:endonuclease-3 related protein